MRSGLVDPSVSCIILQCTTGLAAEAKRATNTQFYEIELLLLGHDILHVGLEEGICLQHFGTDSALDRGFHLGFRTGGYTADSL